MGGDPIVFAYDIPVRRLVAVRLSDNYAVAQPILGHVDVGLPCNDRIDVPVNNGIP